MTQRPHNHNKYLVKKKTRPQRRLQKRVRGGGTHFWSIAPFLSRSSCWKIPYDMSTNFCERLKVFTTVATFFRSWGGPRERDSRENLINVHGGVRASCRTNPKHTRVGRTSRKQKLRDVRETLRPVRPWTKRKSLANRVQRFCTGFVQHFRWSMVGDVLPRTIYRVGLRSPPPTHACTDPSHVAPRQATRSFQNSEF